MNNDKIEFEFFTDKYYDTVNDYLIEAIKKHPDFPKNVVEMVSIMAEESGEAIRAANIYQHEHGQLEDLKTELYQTAAMCIRCLIYLDEQIFNGHQCP